MGCNVLTEKQKHLIANNSKKQISDFYEWISEVVDGLDVLYEKAQHDTLGYLVNELSQYKELMIQREKLIEVRDSVAIVLEYLEEIESCGK